MASCSADKTIKIWCAFTVKLIYAHTCGIYICICVCAPPTGLLKFGTQLNSCMRVYVLYVFAYVCVLRREAIFMMYSDSDLLPNH